MTKVSAAVDDYLYEKRNLRHRTLRWYKQKLSVFSEWCEKENIPLEHIKSRTVDQFLDSLPPDLDPHTKKGYVQVVKGFLNWCSKDDEYEEKVATKTVNKIKLPKVQKSQIEVYTAQEIKDLFSACQKEKNPNISQRDRAILSILVDTGARASELCFDSSRPDERTGLRLDDCHLERHDAWIRVVGKGAGTGKERHIGLGDKSRSALHRYLTRSRGKHDHDFVFCSRTGEPLTVRGLEELIHRLAEWARVEHAYVHKFRHTFAVNYLLQAKDPEGAALYKLMRLLGHSDLATTQIYLRAISHQQAREGGSVLDNLE